jgi:hypothetical protein
MKLHRLTLRDYIVNTFLKLRYEIYRVYFPEKLTDKSEANKEGYSITFEDDFKKTSWGEGGKWIYGEGWGAYHPDNTVCYFAEPEIINGKVVFTSRYAPKTFGDITIPIAVSWLSTVHTHKQKHGIFECRMTLPHAKASTAAFWLWGATWPPEIDVIECHTREGKKVFVYQEVNLYYRYVDSRIKSIKAWKIKLGEHDLNQYYEFRLDWQPDKIKFYTNNVFVFQITDKKLLQYLNEQEEGMHIVVNNNVSPRYITPTEYETYKSEFTVDYIRAYKKLT